LNTALALGSVQSVKVNGVKDLFGNTANSSAPFAPSIVIDGDFSDWAGIAPVYSGPEGVDGAADFKDIYIYNDANYYYFRVTLWHDIPSGSGHFPSYCNMFFDTDGTDATGYFPVTAGPTFGSELLQQSNAHYQEKNGGFNDGVTPVGLDYLMAPSAAAATFPADYEWRLSRNATFGGGGLIFSTNVVSVVFWGQTPGWAAVNFAPASGGTASYTNVASAVVPPLPLGQISMTPMGNGNVALVWDSVGTLQACTGPLLTGTWTNVPTATSPYIIPTAAAQRYFRLKN
jgi:hypothetical protein